MSIELKLFELCNSRDLWSVKTVPKFEEQLKGAGRKAPESAKRYKVQADITQGRKHPARDIENYVKPIIDAITYTQLLWSDDKQIDEICIKRKLDSEADKSSVVILINELNIYSDTPLSQR